MESSQGKESLVGATMFQVNATSSSKFSEMSLGPFIEETSLQVDTLTQPNLRRAGINETEVFTNNRQRNGSTQPGGGTLNIFLSKFHRFPLN